MYDIEIKKITLDLKANGVQLYDIFRIDRQNFICIKKINSRKIVAVPIGESKKTGFRIKPFTIKFVRSGRYNLYGDV